MRRRRRMHLAVFCFVAPLIAILIWQTPKIAKTLTDKVAATLPKIETIEIESVNIPKEVIMQEAGIYEGMAFFDADPRTIETRLKSVKIVESVDVKRSFHGILHVAVTLRQPKAVLSQTPMRYTDKFGVVFGTWKQADAPDLPIFSGFPADNEFTAAQRQKLLLSGVELLEKVESDLSLVVDEVVLDPAYGFSVVSSTVNAPIVFGQPPFDEKLKRLSHILNDQKTRFMHIDWVDLDYNDRAFVRLKQQG